MTTMETTLQRGVVARKAGTVSDVACLREVFAQARRGERTGARHRGGRKEGIDGNPHGHSGPTTGQTVPLLVKVYSQHHALEFR